MRRISSTANELVDRRSDIYFRFCGWRHIFISWIKWCVWHAITAAAQCSLVHG